LEEELIPRWGQVLQGQGRDWGQEQGEGQATEVVEMVLMMY